MLNHTPTEPKRAIGNYAVAGAAGSYTLARHLTYPPASPFFPALGRGVVRGVKEVTASRPRPDRHAELHMHR